MDDDIWQTILFLIIVTGIGWINYTNINSLEEQLDAKDMLIDKYYNEKISLEKIKLEEYHLCDNRFKYELDKKDKCIMKVSDFDKMYSDSIVKDNSIFSCEWSKDELEFKLDLLKIDYDVLYKKYDMLLEKCSMVVE